MSNKPDARDGLQPHVIRIGYVLQVQVQMTLNYIKEIIKWNS